METETQKPQNQKNNENSPKHVKPPVLICEHHLSLKLTSENRGASASQTHEQAPGTAAANLLLEHLFDLPDFFLNFAGVLFSIAFGL